MTPEGFTLFRQDLDDIADGIASLREALTRAAARQAAAITREGGRFTPVGRMVDERTIVNAIVALLATGGSTNHTLHLVAIARAAGIHIDWTDFDELSACVPLLARVYPNGSADVNAFHAAGGTGLLIGELLDACLLHEDVDTVVGRGLSLYRRQPVLEDGRLQWVEGPAASLDASVLASAAQPFSADGGLKLLAGNLGRAVTKVSAVAPELRVVEAPDRAAVDALTDGDPFAKAGCFARVAINPYRIVYKDGVLVMQSAMPVAVFNYLFAVRANRSPEAVASLVLCSTLLSFVFLPLLLVWWLPA